LFYTDRCLLTFDLAKLSTQCSKWYSLEEEQTYDHDLNWQPLRGHNRSKPDPRSAESAFHYTSSLEIRGLPTSGYLGQYGGGGYIANLGQNYNEAYNLTASLERSGWIDKYTRVIFVEFNIYNPNTGLFSLFTMILEVSPIGHVVKWHQVDSVLLYRFTGAAGLVAFVLELLCVVYFLVIIMIEVHAMYKKKMLYFKLSWNWMLLLQIVCFFIAVGFYVYRMIWTSATVEEMMNNKGGFYMVLT
jgi:hypothetical protein